MKYKVINILLVVMFILTALTLEYNGSDGKFFGILAQIHFAAWLIMRHAERDIMVKFKPKKSYMEDEHGTGKKRTFETHGYKRDL